VAQAEGRAAALPLLQFALKRLWPDHVNDRLEEAKWSFHLIENFLVQAADELFETAGGSEEKRASAQRIIRRAFLAMVQLGEGTPDTRRVAYLSEFVASGDDPQDMRNILAPFTAPEARLVSASEQDGEPTYEMTHEALIVSWDRLRAWLGNVPDKAEGGRIRADLRLGRRLSAAAVEWEAGRGSLWRPPELKLLQRARHVRDDLSALDLRFWRWSIAGYWFRKSFGLVFGSAVVIGAMMYALIITQDRYSRIARLENTALAVGQANAEHRQVTGRDPERPLILLALSGSGVGGAASTFSVLKELRATSYVHRGQKRRLIDDVRVVSAVSAASITAAYFGLYGPDGIDNLVSAFLARDNEASFLTVNEQPIEWLRHVMTRDSFRTLLDGQLFHAAKFGSLNRPDKPIIIISATDIASGRIFSFIPQMFDLICSDLDQLAIATGVSASAAVPGSLPPVSLRNYSYEGCTGDIPGGGWIRAVLSLPLPRYLNTEEFQRAAYANVLRNGPEAAQNEHYLHLLDGVLADGQGVGSLMEVLVSPHSLLRILDSLNAGRVKRIGLIGQCAI
jgi:hypothetical protein